MDIKLKQRSESKTWYLHVVVKGNHIKRSTRETNYEKAMQVAEKMAREIELTSMIGKRKISRSILPSRSHYVLPDPDEEWSAAVDACLANKQNWLGYMWQRAKDRSRKRNIKFRLTYEQLIQIARRSDGTCELTGMPFSFERWAVGQAGPYLPVLDRIDAKKGYGIGNCRFVCNFINNAMGCWGSWVISDLIAHVKAAEN